MAGGAGFPFSASSASTPGAIHGGGEPDRASSESHSASEDPESGAYRAQSPSYFIRTVDLMGRRIAGFDCRLDDLDRWVGDLDRLLSDFDIGHGESTPPTLSTDMVSFSSFANTSSFSS